MFNSRQSGLRPGQNLSSDRFRSIEVGVAFKRLTCYTCNLTSVYKYRVKQMRRSVELLPEEDHELLPEEIETWNSIPRFAEIPETIKCKCCGEVLGLYTSCIY